MVCALDIPTLRLSPHEKSYKIHQYRDTRAWVLYQRYSELTQQIQVQKAELALAKARLLELKSQLKINDRQLQSLPCIPLPLHGAEHKSSKMFGNGKSSSALVVQVIETRNLAGVDWDGLSNPYVTLVFDDQSGTLPVLKKNLNPWWNARAVRI